MLDLDYDKEFNYGYIVPDDVLIENPLAGHAFLDPNHPYNKYTICKWDHGTDATSIKITNKIK